MSESKAREAARRVHVNDNKIGNGLRKGRTSIGSPKPQAKDTMNEHNDTPITERIYEKDPFEKLRTELHNAVDSAIRSWLEQMQAENSKENLYSPPSK